MPNTPENSQVNSERTITDLYNLIEAFADAVDLFGDAGEDVKHAAESIHDTVAKKGEDLSKEFDRSQKKNLEENVKAQKTLQGVFLDSLGRTFNYTVGLFENAANKVINNYDAHFTSITSRMQQSAQDYTTMLQDSTKEIKNYQASFSKQSYNLMRSFTQIDFTNQLESAITMGLRGDTAERVAMQNMISQKVLPALTTTNRVYTRTSKILGESFSESVTAMGKYAENLYGSGEGLEQGQADTLLQTLSYEAAASAAERGLTEQEASVEVSNLLGAYQQAVALMGTEGAETMLQNYKNLLAQGYGSADNLTTVAATNAGVEYGNVSTYSAENFNQFIQEYIRQMELAPSTYAGATGYGDYTTSLILKATRAYGDEIPTWTNLSGDVLNEKYEKDILGELSKGLYTSKTEQQENFNVNLVANAMDEMAQHIPDATHWIGEIHHVVSDIYKLLMAKIFTDGATNILGGSGKVAEGAKGLLKAGGTAVKDAALAGTEKFVTSSGATLINAPGALGTFAGSGGLATEAAVAALPLAAGAAGIGAGIYGVKSGISDIQNADETSDKVRGGASIAGGALAGAGGLAVGGAAVAGMLGVGAANAWNPVGWALLLAGGATVAATAIARLSDESRVTVDIMDDLNAKSDEREKALKDQYQSNIDSLYELKGAVDNASSVEKKKTLLLQSGLVTQEELDSSMKTLEDQGLSASDALEKIAQQQIDNGEAQQSAAEYLFDKINTVMDTEQQDIAKQVGDVLRQGANTGNKASFKELSTDDKKTMNTVWGEVQAELGAKVEAEGEDSLTKDEKRVWKNIGEIDFSDGLDKKEYNRIYNGSDEKVTNVLNTYMQDPDFLHRITFGEKGTSVKEAAGLKVAYERDDERAQELVNTLVGAKDVDTVNSTLKQIKDDYGIGWGKLPKQTTDYLVQTFGDENIEKQYKSGSDKITSPTVKALLHAGEAVLNATTAEKLRALAKGQNLASFIETMYKEQEKPTAVGETSTVLSNLVVSAINNQTEVLNSTLMSILDMLSNLTPETATDNPYLSKFKARLSTK